MYKDYSRDELEDIVNCLSNYLSELWDHYDEDELIEKWIDMGFHEDDVKSWF